MAKHFIVFYNGNAETSVRYREHQRIAFMQSSISGTIYLKILVKTIVKLHLHIIHIISIARYIAITRHTTFFVPDFCEFFLHHRFFRVSTLIGGKSIIADIEQCQTDNTSTYGVAQIVGKEICESGNPHPQPQIPQECARHQS